MPELHDILPANNLRPRTVEQLPTLLELCIAQKKIELYRKPEIQIQLEIEERCRSLYSEIEVTEFSTIISNLINNSVDGMPNGGIVQVRLSQTDEGSLIQIIDDGIGIASHLFSKLGTIGFTHGKEHGTGRGLYDAKVTINSWDGQILFSPNESRGLMVSIKLKNTGTPYSSSNRLKDHKVATPAKVR